MNDEKNLSEDECGKSKSMPCGGVSSAVYGLGLIGAAIYFIQNATSFWAGVLGILKAIVWPAFVIYKLLEFLGM
ncbi:MAG: hypothetical protein HQ537_00890 [Parcubacteria group bacterium]|nr:hypothetical protein [Parcubacteria group bacterium]